MKKEQLRQIEQMVGYNFSDHRFLEHAFVHSSGVDDRFLSNERLEFLGDAVLALAICRVLFERFPGYLEGELTKLKSMLVSRRSCATVARQLDIQKHLKLGKGMVSKKALSGSIAAGLLEAVIAAIYLDGGFEPAFDFILRSFGSMIDNADAAQAGGNFKSLLQQHAQQRFGTTVDYELLDEKGPDHNKCFESQAVIGRRHFGSAWGTTKKEAEQKAAFNALVEIGVLKESSFD